MTNENTETTGAVERAAEAILEACYGQDLPEAPVDLARAALTAALDVDKIARAIQSAHHPTTGATPAWEDEDPAWRETYRDMARSVVAHLLGGAA